MTAECLVCFEEFGAEHEPQILIPCCHTICAICAARLAQVTSHFLCPQCQQAITDTKKNFALIEALENFKKKKSLPTPPAASSSFAANVCKTTRLFLSMVKDKPPESVYDVIKSLDISGNLLVLLVHKIYANYTLYFPGKIPRAQFELACKNYTYLLLWLCGSYYVDPQEKPFVDLLRAFHDVCKDDALDQQLLAVAVKSNPKFFDFTF